MVKVLFVTQQMAGNISGGAEIQILKTREYVNKLGSDYSVDLFNGWEDKIKDYDIVHLFNPVTFPTECYAIAKFARDCGKKVVVSPVFYYYGRIRKERWDDIFFMPLSGALANCRKLLLKAGPISVIDPYHNVKKVLSLADKVMPNTAAELGQIIQFFSVPGEKCEIIHNGIELEFKTGEPDLFNEKFGVRDFILFTGRIERRKNVLRLIKAFNRSGLDTKLVIIGGSFDKQYYDLCRKEAGGNILFYPPLPHDSPLLKAAYKSARVFACPSYYETPGLSALEGGLAGANIVITKNGGTTEYFGSDAWYVDPLSEDEIRDAIVDAYNTKKDDKLSKYIENNFTWNSIACNTVEVYNKVLTR